MILTPPELLEHAETPEGQALLWALRSALLTVDREGPTRESFATEVRAWVASSRAPVEEANAAIALRRWVPCPDGAARRDGVVVLLDRSKGIEEVAVYVCHRGTAAAIPPIRIPGARNLAEAVVWVDGRYPLPAWWCEP